MIDLKTLRQLIKLMKDNELTELDIKDGQEQVSLKRSSGEPVVVAPAQPAAHAPAPAAPAAAAPAPAAAPAEKDSGLAAIKSPMVGTFYAAASPDAEPFVQVGSRVEANTVVCVLEAMKVFNEIKAEVSGTIQRVSVTNGDAVEFGQTLFMVRPD